MAATTPPRPRGGATTAAAAGLRLRGLERPLSRIGLGTWAMGGQGWRYSWGRQDDAQSLRTIDTALDLGVDWIDTAPVYGVGHAEELVGRALRGRRSQVAVATKCGFLWKSGSRRPYPRLTAASVFGEIEASLRRLGTDYVDLYQIHWPGPNCDLVGGWESIERLVEQGKVRCGGVCNLTVDQLAKLPVGHHAPASLQLPCNLIDRPSRELVDDATRRGMCLLGYSPLASGRLCTGFGAERLRGLPGDDWRLRHPSFSPAAMRAQGPVLDAARGVADAAGHSLEEVALAWALAAVGGSGGVVVGGRTPAQIAGSVGGRSVAAEVVATLDAAVRC